MKTDKSVKNVEGIDIGKVSPVQLKTRNAILVEKQDISK